MGFDDIDDLLVLSPNKKTYRLLVPLLLMPTLSLDDLNRRLAQACFAIAHESSGRVRASFVTHGCRYIKAAYDLNPNNHKIIRWIQELVAGVYTQSQKTAECVDLANIFNLTFYEVIRGIPDLRLSRIQFEKSLTIMRPILSNYFIDTYCDLPIVTLEDSLEDVLLDNDFETMTHPGKTYYHVEKHFEDRKWLKETSKVFRGNDLYFLTQCHFANYKNSDFFPQETDSS